MSKTLLDYEYKLENTNIYDIKLYKDSIWNFGNSLFNANSITNCLIRFINYDIQINVNVKIYYNKFNMITYSSGHGNLAYNYSELNQEEVKEVEEIKEEEEEDIYELLEENTMCPISMTEIKESDKYEKCNECQNIFSHNTINSWLQSPVSNGSCPLCRSIWSIEDRVIYTNSDIYELSSEESTENT